jgi:hypothetical protein
MRMTVSCNDEGREGLHKKKVCLQLLNPSTKVFIVLTGSDMAAFARGDWQFRVEVRYLARRHAIMRGDRRNG